MQTLEISMHIYTTTKNIKTKEETMDNDVIINEDPMDVVIEATEPRDMVEL